MIRKLILCALAALAFSVQAQPKGEVARYVKGDDLVVFTDLRDDCHAPTTKVFAVVTGQAMQGCWVDFGDKVVFEFFGRPSLFWVEKGKLTFKNGT